MNDRQSQTDDGTDAAARRSAKRWLDAVPPLGRSVVYYVFFLGFILVLAPLGAHYVADALLGWRVELGTIRVAGWAVFALFFLLYTYCSFVLILRGRGTYVEFDPPREFVATGPFRACRNPIAACVLGMLLGLGVAWSSAGILALFLIALPLAQYQVVRVEEPLLEQRFGQTYREYKQRVPRWLPRVRRGDDS